MRRHLHTVYIVVRMYVCVYVCVCVSVCMHTSMRLSTGRPPTRKRALCTRMCYMRTREAQRQTQMREWVRLRACHHQKIIRVTVYLLRRAFICVCICVWVRKYVWMWVCANVDSSELICAHVSMRELYMFTYTQVFAKWK